MNLLPPADLLQRISGVEQGLRQNQKGGQLGSIGLAVSVAQLAIAALGFEADSLTNEQKAWIVVAGLLLGASIVLYTRSRVWIRESSAPFRYTCSVAEFNTLGAATEQDSSEVPAWIKYDLAEMLNQRIGRLSFLEDGEPEKEPAAEGANEHIHIAGDLLVRRRKDEKRWIEVAPRVRVGKKGEPATLAQAASQVWREASKDDESLQMSGAQGESGPTKPRVHPDDYEKLIERIYFNLASHIYREIQTDILRKIGLLPTRYLRATAYLHEADDYANSNTLDGLDEAINLYRSSMELFDPRTRRLPRARIRRLARQLLRLKARTVAWLRQKGSTALPALGRGEVKVARAEVGLANALLHRRTLAGMSGRRVNSIYEAPLLAKRAIARLEKLADDVPDRQQALFDAHVSCALACYQLESPGSGRKSLERARRVLPMAYDQDPRYLYVQGLLEDLPASALRFLRLAVERQPRFEVAQFELALKFEMTWRTRQRFEVEGATVILNEYKEVLKLNPGNVAAWGHAAYIYWLLKDFENATAFYESGRQFKQLKRDTAVAELDYGLARIALEQVEEGQREPGGQDETPLSDAYGHYVSAASAQLLQGVSDWKSTSAQFYIFDAMSPAMMERYEQYRKDALRFLDSGPTEERRVRDVIKSFVWTDYGEACYSYHLRNCDPARLAEAKQAFETAEALNVESILPRYNLYLLLMHMGEYGAAIDELDELRRTEPNWNDAVLARVAAPADAASRELSRQKSHNTEQWKASAQRKLAEVVSDAGVRHDLSRLVPQAWLWRKDRTYGEDIRWNVFSGRQDRAIRWEEDLDELNVQALFQWSLACLLAETIPDEDTRARSRRRRAAREALTRIESHFWPGNFSLLFTLHQLECEEQKKAILAGAPSSRKHSERETRLREVVERWLKESPTSYWALELVSTDFYDLAGRRIQLFYPEERGGFLRKAKERLAEDARTGGANPKLEEWITERLDDQGASGSTNSGATGSADLSAAGAR